MQWMRWGVELTAAEAELVAAVLEGAEACPQDGGDPLKACAQALRLWQTVRVREAFNVAEGLSNPAGQRRA